MARTKGAVADDVRRLLRAVKDIGPDDRERRTVALRDLAEVSVELREHFITPSGEPDWAGRTWAYRDFMRGLYRDANMTPEETRSTQAAVRYHVGNVLRTRLSEQEIEDLGLKTSAPVERARDARGERSALLRAARERVNDVDGVRAVGAALALLQGVDAAKLAELNAEDRQTVRATFAGVVAEIDRLREATNHQ